MINSLTQNPIRINQVGFKPESPKRFILTDNKTGDDTFTIYFDTCKKEAYRGKMVLEDAEEGLWTGDFSCVSEPGDYYVCAGGHKSRFFWIFDKAYDQLSRILLSYFTYQRCGSELGWAGTCHMDDGIIKETGERVDLSGGYHQSGDLRKSPGGVSIGVLGMLRYAMKDSSQWGKILLADEARWACDYYVKNIQENGAMYNTLSAPFGWGPRVFYKSAAPSSAQWCATSILALGSMYFKNTDKVRSEKYLAAALRSWDYMNGNERSYETYTHPDETPRGMDASSFYYCCKRDNTADMAYMAVVAADLYDATGDAKYLEYIKKGADKMVSLMGDGDMAMCVFLDDDSENLAFMYSSYGHTNGGFMAMCAACEYLKDNSKYLDALKKITDAICKCAKNNPWRLFKSIRTDADLDMAAPHGDTTIRNIFGETDYIGSVYKENKEVKCYTKAAKLNSVSPTIVTNLGVFLKRASKILDHTEADSVAQAQIDAILGANAFDASHVNAVGVNHIDHLPSGQFFPPTPYIPGAVNIGFNSIEHTTYSEYDMPCVGMFMYLISEYLD